MKRIEPLTTALHERARKAMPAGGFGDAREMREIAPQLEARFVDGVDFDVDHDRLGAALRALDSDQSIGPRDVIRLCVASTSPVGDRPPLCTDPVLIDRLVARVSGLQRPAHRGRCAVSLVWAWLQPATAPWPSARETQFAPLGAWAMRELAGLRPDARSGSLLEVAAEHAPDLLDIRPGHAASRFVGYVIDGDDDVRAPLDRLRVPGSSWIWTEILIGAITDVCLRGGRDLIRFLDERHPLIRLDQHPLVYEEGLGLLLRHYSRSVSGTPERDDLRDAAIAAFGNPKSTEHQAAWDRYAGADARKMVNRWLNRRIVEYGFTRLPSGRADPKRAPFWSRYAEYMDDIWIHAGLESRQYRSKVVREMREMLDGQVRDLEEETTDVFVFTIGQYEFVEFTTTGGACYVYHRDADKPYNVRRSGHRNGDFKDTQGFVRDTKMTHMGSWEPRFRDAIAARTGVYVNLI